MNGVDAVAVATPPTGAPSRAPRARLPRCAAEAYRPLSEYALERDDKTNGNGEPRISALLARLLDARARRSRAAACRRTRPTGTRTPSSAARPARSSRASSSPSGSRRTSPRCPPAIEGINKGHMAPARNIASAAGAPVELAREVGDHMVSVGSINIETAQAYLRAHRLWPHAQTDANGRDAAGTDSQPPSSLLVRLTVPRPWSAPSSTRPSRHLASGRRTSPSARGRAPTDPWPAAGRLRRRWRPRSRRERVRGQLPARSWATRARPRWRRCSPSSTASGCR